jgi:hypothetical protein
MKKEICFVLFVELSNFVTAQETVHQATMPAGNIASQIMHEYQKNLLRWHCLKFLCDLHPNLEKFEMRSSCRIFWGSFIDAKNIKS